MPSAPSAVTCEDIGVKFTALGASVIGAYKCKRAGEWIMSLEKHDSVGGVFDLTTA